jgi:hypothetical protein
MMKESDDMYNPTFIKVNIFILFYLFIFIKKNYFTHNILKKRKLLEKLQASQSKTYIRMMILLKQLRQVT